jgi:hypothetical protein|tara:strand:+ start:1439 stop:1663 length:225 start_codon:yes stop_codon:yes gene_type:complete
MFKTLAHVDELENAQNANGYNLRNSKKIIEKIEKEKAKPINPKEVFEGNTFKNLKKGTYRSANPVKNKTIKEWE